MTGRKFKPFAKATVTIRNNRTGFVWRSPKAMKVFVDTGASITVLPFEAVPVLKEKTGPFDVAPARIQTVNGPKEAVALRDVSFCLEAVCYRGDVVVTDGVAGDIMVGSDFLASSKCAVDFGRKRIRCEGKDLPFKLEA